MAPLVLLFERQRGRERRERKSKVRRKGGDWRLGPGLSPGQTRKLENQGQSLLLYFLCTLLSHEAEARGEGLGSLQDPSQEETLNSLIKRLYKNISGWGC